MRCLTGRHTACVLLVISAMACNLAVVAQPVPDRILDSIIVAHEDEADAVHISLNISARYLSHFPHQTGNELRIRIRLFDVRPDDRDALVKRESIVPFGDDQKLLREVVYEGDMDGGPYLTVFFSQAVNFRVEQGRDSRSIVVYIERPVPEPPDRPVTDTGG